MRYYYPHLTDERTEAQRPNVAQSYKLEDDKVRIQNILILVFALNYCGISLDKFPEVMGSVLNFFYIPFTENTIICLEPKISPTTWDSMAPTVTLILNLGSPAVPTWRTKNTARESQ